MTNKSRATGYRPNVGSTYESSFKSKDKRERKIKEIEFYQVKDEKTDFVIGTVIARQGRVLYAITNKEKLQGARMVGYYSKFLIWKKQGSIKQI